MPPCSRATNSHPSDTSACFCRWQPLPAYRDPHAHRPVYETPRKDILLVPRRSPPDFLPSPSIAATFLHAISAYASPGTTFPWAADQLYHAHETLDLLNKRFTRLQDITILARLRENDELVPLKNSTLPPGPLGPFRKLPPRRHSIVVRVELLHVDSTTEVVDIPTDFALVAKEPEPTLETNPPWLTARIAHVTGFDITQALEQTTFLPSFDPQADSVTTQRRNFRLAALHLATRTLENDVAAAQAVIPTIVNQHAHWALPPDTRAEITISHGETAASRISKVNAARNPSP